MKYLFASFIAILCCSCSSPTQEQLEIIRRPAVKFVNPTAPNVCLSRDYILIQKRALFDYKYTLPSGRYDYYGEDAEGAYYIHSASGVLLSTGFRPAKGGFFVPHATAKRLIIWWKPDGPDVAIALLGPLAAGIASDASPLPAMLVIHLSDEMSAQIRGEIHWDSKQTKSSTAQRP